MNLPFVSVRKPDGAQHAFALRFNQLSNDREHFRQWRSSKNQFKNVEHGFAGKEARLVRRPFCTRKELYEENRPIGSR